MDFKFIKEFANSYVTMAVLTKYNDYELTETKFNGGISLYHPYNSITAVMFENFYDHVIKMSFRYDNAAERKKLLRIAESQDVVTSDGGGWVNMYFHFPSKKERDKHMEDLKTCLLS